MLNKKKWTYERLEIAFELNGPQHYHPIYGIDKLMIQQHLDELKRKACKKNNVVLIEIPFDFDGSHFSIDENQLQDYIIKNVEYKTGTKIPKIPRINNKTQNFKRLDKF